LSAETHCIRRILDACLEDRELGWEDAVTLSGARGDDQAALFETADALRKRQAGETVTYVVNRNVNFTNVCIKTCKFCAFSRLQRSEQAYFLDEEEIVRRALQAQEMGATEVCIQAGLAPGVDGRIYVRLCRAVKQAAPNLHVHAFSPEEIQYGAHLSKVSIKDYLTELKDAGLGSLPGTSAEVLDDEVRTIIAPGRITTAEWIEVNTQAHALGIPTTSTLMYGHVETDAQRMRHLELLRTIQKETRGFTEFVPLSFVHEEAPLFKQQLVRRGPERDGVVRLYAIARLMLGATFRNVQVSWVKEGLAESKRILRCGANDLGGTLMNESISTTAGAQHGQLMTPKTLRAAIREVGRVPEERTTLYRTVRSFDATGDGDVTDPLDRVEDAEAVFGSYAALARDERFRFRRPRAS